MDNLSLRKLATVLGVSQPFYPKLGPAKDIYQKS